MMIILLSTFMIIGVKYDKLLNELKERGITQYSLVDARRNTKDYDEYYDKDVIRLSNSVFETMKNGGYVTLETLIKFMNILGKDSIDELITYVYDDDDPRNVKKDKEKEED